MRLPPPQSEKTENTVSNTQLNNPDLLAIEREKRMLAEQRAQFEAEVRRQREMQNGASTATTASTNTKTAPITLHQLIQNETVNHVLSDSRNETSIYGKY